MGVCGGVCITPFLALNPASVSTLLPAPISDLFVTMPIGDRAISIGNGTDGDGGGSAAEGAAVVWEMMISGESLTTTR